MARLEVGQRAPRFTLLNQDLAKVSLGDFRGERVVVYFYPADDTPGCTREARQFNDLLSDYRAARVNVLGVSPDSPESHVAFRAKYALDFDLLSDPKKKVMTAYGAYGEKMLYGKKVVGVLRSTFVVAANGTIEHAFYGVRTDGHARRVLERLTREGR